MADGVALTNIPYPEYDYDLVSDINPDALISGQIDIPNYMAVRCLARSVQELANEYHSPELDNVADLLALISVSIEKGER